MARAGRKPKSGIRTKSGRTSRAGYVPTFDKGTDRTQAMQAIYGPDGSDAIGRAFRSGLLGEGSEGKALLDLARALHRAYWIAYEVGPIASAIGERSHGSVIDLDHERIKKREQWLSGCLDDIRRMGPDVNRAFRQLVIDVNPDHGPQWLDRLCFVHRCGKVQPHPRDEQALRAALDGLEFLAS